MGNSHGATDILFPNESAAIKGAVHLDLSKFTMDVLEVAEERWKKYITEYYRGIPKLRKPQVIAGAQSIHIRVVEEICKLGSNGFAAVQDAKQIHANLALSDLCKRIEVDLENVKDCPDIVEIVRKNLEITYCPNLYSMMLGTLQKGEISGAGQPYKDILIRELSANLA